MQAVANGYAERKFGLGVTYADFEEAARDRRNPSQRQAAIAAREIWDQAEPDFMEMWIHASAPLRFTAANARTAA